MSDHSAEKVPCLGLRVAAFSWSFCRGLLRGRVGSVFPPHPVLASSAHRHRESPTFVWFCSELTLF